MFKFNDIIGLVVFLQGWQKNVITILVILAMGSERGGF